MTVEIKNNSNHKYQIKNIVKPNFLQNQQSIKVLRLLKVDLLTEFSYPLQNQCCKCTKPDQNWHLIISLICIYIHSCALCFQEVKFKLF